MMRPLGQTINKLNEGNYRSENTFHLYQKPYEIKLNKLGSKRNKNYILLLFYFSFVGLESFTQAPLIQKFVSWYSKYIKLRKQFSFLTRV